jgi:hypothetical protein
MKTGVVGKSVLIDGALCKITARNWTEETSPMLINRNGQDLPPCTVRAYRCCFDIVRPGGRAARLVVMPPWLNDAAQLNPVEVTAIPPVAYSNGLGGGGTLNALVRFAELGVARRCFVEIQQAPTETPAPTAILPGWKHGKLILKSVPNGKKPGVFAFGRKTYSVPSGKAWACVCSLIEAGGFDSHGVAMRSPSGLFKREHRAFFTERMTKGAGWYIKTL